jgi:hypothetical protein
MLDVAAQRDVSRDRRVQWRHDDVHVDHCRHVFPRSDSGVILSPSSVAEHGGIRADERAGLERQPAERLSCVSSGRLQSVNIPRNERTYLSDHRNSIREADRAVRRLAGA